MSARATQRAGGLVAAAWGPGFKVGTRRTPSAAVRSVGTNARAHPLGLGRLHAICKLLPFEVVTFGRQVVQESSNLIASLLLPLIDGFNPAGLDPALTLTT